MASTQQAIVKSGFTRVWIIPDGASPKNIPEFEGLLKAGDPSRGFGDVTAIEIPDPARFNEFIEIDSIRGATERATFSLQGRYPLQLSRLLKLANQGCRVDIQVHIGKCRDPRDYDNGWEKMVIFEDANITSYGIEGFGAIDSSERAPANETVEISAGTFYEVGRLSFSTIASSTIDQEMISVDVFGSPVCEECLDEVAPGCDTVMAVMDTDGLVNPLVIYTDDAFATFSTVLINTLGTETPTDSEFVGNYFAVISENGTATGDELNWAGVNDILNGTAAPFQSTSAGFNVAGPPLAMSSTSPRDTFIVGRGGYIYKMESMGNVVEVDSAEATSNDYLDVYALDAFTVVAVGASNTVVVTRDSGATWQLISPGPAPGDDLTTVWAMDENTWLIGTDAGELYCTSNSGDVWQQVTLPIVATNINDIVMATESVGVLAVTQAGPAGVLLRTTNAGQSWRVLPDGAGTLPANDQISKVAMCPTEPNLVYGAGLSDAPPVGILIKGS